MSHTDKNSSDQFELEETLKLIAFAQNQGLNTVNPDHLYLKLIMDTFKAKGIVLVSVDHDRAGILTKKESTNGNEWKITSDIPSKPSLVETALKNYQIKNWDVHAEDSVYNVEIDGIKGIETHNIVSAPVRSHSVIYGAVNLINSKSFPMDSTAKAHLALFLTALGDVLYYEDVLRETTGSLEEASYTKAQLLQSRNVLRSIFDNIPQSYYIIDKDYTITGINRARSQRTPNTPRELYGRICYQALYDLQLPCADCRAAETFLTGKSTRRIAVERQPKSKSLDWSITTYPVFNEEKAVDRVVLMEEDITENRKMEVEVLQSEKLVAIGQLAAGIAHEINNPLTSILVNSQILLEDLPPDQKENIESVKLIEMAAVRSSQVIKNLLGLVRKETYEFEEMDLNETIQSALMMVSHEFLTRKIKITFNRAEQLPLYKGSASHLQGVWINLLLNAIEAIGEKPGEIKITTIYDSGTFYVEFKDTGVGISEENLGRIFEPYFTTKRSGQGTGLGLSLVKRTIQVHGGQIMVESSPGEGARFTIILPEAR